MSLAPGHNPDGLCPRQVGKGWRLLTREEVDHRNHLNGDGEHVTREIQRHVKGRWRAKECMGSDFAFAYRTKRPVGYWLPPKPPLAPELVALRTAVADYMQSEGCSCCRDEEGHRIHQATLAKLLDVPPYSDGSGHDFNQFCTKPTKIR